MTASLELPVNALAARTPAAAEWSQRRDRAVLLADQQTASQYAPAEMRPETPRAFMATLFDPGAAAYRYHAAANTSGGGVASFVRWEHENPHCDLRQFDGDADRWLVEQLARSADIVHVHMDYSSLRDHLGFFPARDQLLVRHYHGSWTEGMQSIIETKLDDSLGAVQIGARLYHSRYSERMQWLPIPMPTREYAALSAALWSPPHIDRPLRLAHSPTNRRLKGTTAMMHCFNAVERRHPGEIELVLIEGKSQAEALALKATCDITFDSFWLGIQGSGLEAAAMGQMVIAGDPAVRDDYERAGIAMPYSFAGNPDELCEVLERALIDPAWRAAEAARVKAYAVAWHDYIPVGERYWALMRAELAARGLSSGS